MGYHHESEKIAHKVASVLGALHDKTTTTASSSTTSITSNTSHKEEEGQNLALSEEVDPEDAPPHPAPVVDSSPAKLNATSCQSSGFVKFLANGTSESSESVWDYDHRPLKQTSLTRSLCLKNAASGEVAKSVSNLEWAGLLEKKWLQGCTRGG